MASKLTPEQRKLIIEWIDNNPEAILDFIRDPEAFYGEYSDASQYIDVWKDDRSLSRTDPIWVQASAFDDLVDLRTSVFSAKARA
jgi:hypothetical protein